MRAIGAPSRRQSSSHHVPRGPRPGGPRQDAGVGVEQRPVARVAEGAEESDLLRARVGEHPQRLVGVGGEHDPVEAAPLPPLRQDLHPLGARAGPRGRRSRRGRRAPAGRRSPRRSGGFRPGPSTIGAGRWSSQPWLSMKRRRERAEKRRTSAAEDDQTAPTRGSMKWRAKASGKLPSSRNSPRVRSGAAGIVEKRPGPPVEARDAGQHPQVARVHGAVALGEEPVEHRGSSTRAGSGGSPPRRTCPTGVPPPRARRGAARSRGRCGGCRRGSRCPGPTRWPSCSTVWVWAWPPRRRLLLEQLHVVAAAEQVGGGEPGDAPPPPRRRAARPEPLHH